MQREKEKADAIAYLRENVDPIFTPLLESLLRSRPSKENIPAFIKDYFNGTAHAAGAQAAQVTAGL